MEATTSYSQQASEALNRAIDTLGSQVATARLLGVTQGAVSKWVRKGLPLPPEHVLKIEAASGVSKHDLRPDIYPRETLAPVSPSSAQGAPSDMEPAR